MFSESSHFDYPARKACLGHPSLAKRCQICTWRVRLPVPNIPGARTKVASSAMEIRYYFRYRTMGKVLARDASKGWGLITDKSEIDESRFTAFQSLFYVANQDSIEGLLKAQLLRWLEEKGFGEIDLEESGYYPKQGKELRFVHSVSSDGTAYQARLSERTDSGIWRSTFTFSIPRSRLERGWLLVKISNDMGAFAKTPRLIRYLVENQLVVDGISPLPLEAQVFRFNMLEELFEVIKSEQRRTPVFVAATDDSRDFDAFYSKAKLWASKLPGIAHLVVLDPPASKRWREVLGEDFAVPSWTIRSYLPGVSMENTFDPRRHKILGQTRLAEPEHRVRATLERIARGIAHQEVFPEYVHGTLRRIQRLEDRAMIEAITSNPAPESSVELRESVKGEELPAGLEEIREHHPIADEAQIYLTKINLVQSILGLEDLDEKSLERLARMANSGFKAQSALESLTAEFMSRQDKVEELMQLNDELESSLSEIDGEVGQLEDENRRLVSRLLNLEKKNDWLLRQVDESQRYSNEYLSLESDNKLSPPDDWEDFVLKVSNLEEFGIIFTGDPKLALEIEQNDDWGNIVRSAWDCVEVLVNYQHAKNNLSWTLGVDEFIAHQGVFPARKHARNETGYTRRQSMKDRERDFPVPLSVDPTGFATMFTHFKLGKKGRVDPRMYYLDNYPNDGKIYIAYVGVHLRNRQTN